MNDIAGFFDIDRPNRVLKSQEKIEQKLVESGFIFLFDFFFRFKTRSSPLVPLVPPRGVGGWV